MRILKKDNFTLVIEDTKGYESHPDEEGKFPKNIRVVTALDTVIHIEEDTEKSSCHSRQSILVQYNITLHITMKYILLYYPTIHHTIVHCNTI